MYKETKKSLVTLGFDSVQAVVRIYLQLNNKYKKINSTFITSVSSYLEQASWQRLELLD
jgi:hypothetical protein